jgi:hypothetical protein
MAHFVSNNAVTHVSGTGKLVVMGAAAAVETPIPTDMRLHLDATDDTTIRDASDVPVTVVDWVSAVKWHDKSGLGNHADLRNGSANIRTAMFNGNNIMRCNATWWEFRIAANRDFLSGAVAGTIFICFTYEDNSTHPLTIVKTGLTPNAFGGRVLAESHGLTGSPNTGVSLSPNQDTLVVYAIRGGPTVTRLYANNSSTPVYTDTFDASNWGGATAFAISTDQAGRFYGRIGEMLVYNYEFSDAQFASTMTALTTKWGIA